MHRVLESSRFVGREFWLECSCGTSLPVMVAVSWKELSDLLRLVWGRHTGAGQ